MLELIAKALTDYQAKGFAVLAPAEGSGVDAREAAHYVIQTLEGLNCSFNHYYNSIENSYFFEDHG